MMPDALLESFRAVRSKNRWASFGNLREVLDVRLQQMAREAVEFGGISSTTIRQANREILITALDDFNAYDVERVQRRFRQEVGEFIVYLENQLEEYSHFDFITARVEIDAFNRISRYAQVFRKAGNATAIVDAVMALHDQACSGVGKLSVKQMLLEIATNPDADFSVTAMEMLADHRVADAYWTTNRARAELSGDLVSAMARSAANHTLAVDKKLCNALINGYSPSIINLKSTIFELMINEINGLEASEAGRVKRLDKTRELLGEHAFNELFCAYFDDLLNSNDNLRAAIGVQCMWAARYCGSLLKSSMKNPDEFFSGAFKDACLMAFCDNSDEDKYQIFQRCCVSSYSVVFTPEVQSEDFVSNDFSQAFRPFTEYVEELFAVIISAYLNNPPQKYERGSYDRTYFEQSLGKVFKVVQDMGEEAAMAKGFSNAVEKYIDQYPGSKTVNESAKFWIERMQLKPEKMTSKRCKRLLLESDLSL